MVAISWPQDTPFPLNPPGSQRAGEAEAATEKKPSCFPDFANINDFKSYVGAAASAALPVGRAGWLAAVACAAAFLALL